MMADDVLRQGVQGISELITEPGEINIDFADVRTVMKGKGDAIMGIGIGEGATRAIDAARQAINNPLLENAKIDGAKSVLVNLTAGDGLTLTEYQDVVELITQNCEDDALIIAGQAYDADLGDKVKVTVVATGFNHEDVTVDMGFERPRKRFDDVIRPEKEEAKQPADEIRQTSELEQEDDGVITKSRWQDLISRMGRSSADSDNYTMPSINRGWNK